MIREEIVVEVGLKFDGYETTNKETGKIILCTAGHVTGMSFFVARARSAASGMCSMQIMQCSGREVDDLYLDDIYLRWRSRYSRESM
jgi:hypothetical protein